MENRKELQNLGWHPERLPGEVLISYCSDFAFTRLDYWKTKRLGEKRIEAGTTLDKKPFFIQREEAFKRGWIIR